MASGTMITPAPASTSARADHASKFQCSLIHAVTVRCQSSTPMLTAVTARRSNVAMATSRRVRERCPRSCRERAKSAIQEEYSATKFCSGRGSFRSTHEATPPAERMSHGVESVVTAETATATG